jgi:Protein of unknown function (DUF1559)
MATGSFKTPCPSCEAGVLVRDRSLIGKKIDCPKCKYRFVVEDPKKAGVSSAKKADRADDDEVADDLEEVEEDQSKKAATGKKPAVAAVKGKADAKTAAPTKAKAKPAAKKEEDDEEEENKPKKKGKKAGSNKMMLGLVLAGVGVAVLGVAGFLVLGGKGDTKKKGGTPVVPPAVARGNTSAQPDGKDTKKDANPTPVAPTTSVAVSGPGPALTNLLPSQAQHVTHVFFKDLFDTFLLAEAAFQPAVFDDDDFKRRLGFSVRALDDLLRAENYSNRWALTVAHLKEALNEKAVTEALGLQPAAGSPMNGQPFFKVTRNGPWLEQLARMSLGTFPSPRLAPAKGEDRPLLVWIVNPQTLVFADVAPMQELLARKAPMGDGSAATYTTLKPALKTMLDKMEKTTPSSNDRVLYSAVTDLDAARLDSGRSGRPEWHFRPIWDVAHALPENPQRLKLLGATLVRRGKTDPAAYLYQNEIDCENEADAKTVRKDLQDAVAPELARFCQMLLGLKVKLPPPVAAPAVTPMPVPPPPAPATTPPAKDLNDSKITLADTDKTVVFSLDLLLNDKASNRLGGAIELAMYGLRGELELAAGGVAHRHQLADAAKHLGEQGIPDHGVPAGNFPYGVFKRADAKNRSAREPGRRISWMAGLLPFLGKESLYARIKFDASWKDPVNWMTARTLVPEFLDPAYPEWARVAPYPGIPFPLGGTHFVGIAGIGQDAPDYTASDPAVVAKLGVFGYNRMTSLAEINKNRGLSATALMVQVPYDGPAGVTPWMAGGGSTIRGVPEKNSVKPFVSTGYNGKRGTFVLMADNSVRFVTEDIKDEVFQAMCTVKGPADVAALDRDAPKVEGPKKTDVKPRPKEVVKKDPAVTPKSNAPPGWQEATSVEGGFAVFMPGKATQTKITLPPAAGVASVPALTLNHKGTDYAAFALPLAPFGGNLTPEQRLEKAKGIVLARFAEAGQVKSEKDIKVGLYPGKEVVFDVAGKVIVVCRYFVTEQSAYAAGMTSFDPEHFNVTAPEVTTFLNSFRLVTPAPSSSAAPKR